MNDLGEGRAATQSTCLKMQTYPTHFSSPAPLQQTPFCEKVRRVFFPQRFGRGTLEEDK